MVKLRKLYAKNLNNEDAKKCYSLTYRNKGQMSNKLTISRKHTDLSAKCYMLEENKKLLAWAIVFNKEEVHLYVRKSERRKGLGTRLINCIEKDYNPKTLSVEKHDSVSDKFFSNTKYNIRTNSDYNKYNN